MKRDDAWLTFGCHPKYASSFTPAHIPALKTKLLHERSVAVGPCGLNYTLATSVESQKSAFMAQVELAVQMKIPIVIQCPQSDRDCFNILRKVRVMYVHQLYFSQHVFIV
jgi:TatD DNase family protein